ncbi:MAG: hypothetical protein DCC67_17045 [Planctomycetota bacterium]|nr:MAG: hypothetical protein DCC67_17045 [Planctomycetota bacterium]
MQFVRAAVSRNEVTVISAVEVIITDAAVESVSTIAATDNVVTIIAIDTIVPSVAGDLVGALRAVNQIISFTAGNIDISWGRTGNREVLSVQRLQINYVVSTAPIYDQVMNRINMNWEPVEV